MAGRKPVQAFSLIEIVVSISVLVLLLAISVPFLIRARSEGENIRCLANLRVASAAVHSMASDNGGLFKTWARGNSSTGTGVWGWNLLRLNYIESREVLRCPSGESTFSLDNDAWYHNTYGVNMLMPDGTSDSARGNSQDYELNLFQVMDPSRHIFLVDSAERAFMPGKPGARSQRFRANMDRLTDGIQLRHSNRANVIFLDGHIESLTRERAQDFFKEDLIYEANP